MKSRLSSETAITWIVVGCTSLLVLAVGSVLRIRFETSPQVSIDLRELTNDMVTSEFEHQKVSVEHSSVFWKVKSPIMLSIHKNVSLIPTTETFDTNVLELILVRDVNDFKISILQVTDDIKLSSWIPTFLLWPELSISRSEAATKFQHYADDFFSHVCLKSKVYVIYPLQMTDCVSADCVRFSIWEAYSVAGIMLRNEVHFRNSELSSLMEISSGIIRRKNTRHGVLKAISVNDSAWENETKFRQRDANHTEIEFEAGYAVYMLWVIRDFFNFSVQAEQGNWTEIIEAPNGTSWLVGNGRTVATGKADISISQHALNLGYMQHGLYLLHPTNSAGLRLFFIQPEMSHYRDIFVTPFERSLWLAVFVSFAITVVALKSFGWTISHVAEVEEGNHSELVQSAVVWGVAVLAQQGFHVEPSSMSIRVVFFSGYITGLVCFVAYSAQIVSTLSVKSVPIHTADDILNGPFQLYANPDNTPKPVINYILKERKRGTESVFIEEQEAIRRIMNRSSELQSLIAEPDIFYTEARALNCTKKQLCEMFSSLHLNRAPIKGGMFVAKGSPYIEWFNYAIILMLERGLNHRFVSNYNRRSWVICLDEKTAFVQSVKVADILSAFKILLSGYISSIILLACELALAHRGRRVADHDGFIN